MDRNVEFSCRGLIIKALSMHQPDLFICSGFSVNLQVFLLLFFRPFMKVCEVGLFNTCLALLKALIEVSLKTKLHMAF